MSNNKWKDSDKYYRTRKTISKFADVYTKAVNDGYNLQDIHFAVTYLTASGMANIGRVMIENYQDQLQKAGYESIQDFIEISKAKAYEEFKEDLPKIREMFERSLGPKK